MRHTAITVFLALGVLGVSSPLVLAADGVGGSDIVMGKITRIEGDHYSVLGVPRPRN